MNALWQEIRGIGGGAHVEVRVQATAIVLWLRVDSKNLTTMSDAMDGTTVLHGCHTLVDSRRCARRCLDNGSSRSNN